MCGRYEAGQKQKIAEAFHVSITLDDIYFQRRVGVRSWFRPTCDLHERL
jgi:hypothetical protein